MDFSQGCFWGVSLMFFCGLWNITYIERAIIWNPCRDSNKVMTRYSFYTAINQLSYHKDQSLRSRYDITKELYSAYCRAYV
jgi:hypothetical protein